MRLKTSPPMIAVFLCVAFTACVPTRPARVAAAPPAPVPASVPEPESMPISIVQDASVLPPSQPVPPEALPPLDPPEQVAARPQPSENSEAARRRTSTARKPAEAVPAPSPAPAAVLPAPAHPGKLVASDPNLPGREALNAKILDVKSSAARIPKTSMSNSQRLTYKRVESFIKMAESALARGDLRQAGELADRAAALARALTP